MDYPCGKFGNCSCSRFGSIVRTERQTDERYTPATLVLVSNVAQCPGHKYEPTKIQTGTSSSYTSELGENEPTARN